MKQLFYSFLGLILFVFPRISLACSTCFGAPDSPQAQGVRFAMISLLGVTGLVLGSFGAFFIFLIRKGRETRRNSQ